MLFDFASWNRVLFSFGFYFRCKANFGLILKVKSSTKKFAVNCKAIHVDLFFLNLAEFALQRWRVFRSTEKLIFFEKSENRLNQKGKEPKTIQNKIWTKL